MTAVPIRLLLLEDNPGDARLVQAALADHAPGEFAVTGVERLADALARVGTEGFDAVLSDLGLPDSTGLATAQAIVACAPALALVVLTGSHNQDLGRESIRHGAQDYLVKGESDGALIARTLRYAIERKRLEGGLRAANEALERRVAERTAELEAAIRKLSASEMRFRSLTEMSSDFYWESDVEHRFTARTVTGKASQVAVFQRAAQMGERRWDIAYLSPDEAGWQAHRAVLDAHRPFRGFEFSRVGVDGSERHVTVSGDPVFDASGAFTGYRGVGTDITERKRQEQKIARLTRIQAVLSGINSAIVRIRDRQELFEEACRIAVEHGNFGAAWIGEYDPDTGDVKPIAWKGMDDGAALMKASGRSDIPEGQGMVGRAIREKKPAITNDITADPMAGGPKRSEALRKGFRSIISMPLIVDGEVKAALTLFATERNFFSGDEMKLLTELAGDISFALDHIRKEEKLNYLAYYDSLTGLANRTLFLDRLSQPLNAKDAGRNVIALALLDIVRFRAINDTLGRQAGDELLRLVAQRLGAPHAGYDAPARVGVNCFALELSGMRDPAEVAYALEGILRSGFGEPFQVQGTELRIAAKCGIALFPSDGKEAETLFRNAEAALARAKRSAEAVMFYAPAMNARVSEALAMENKLRKAIDLGQFVLHFQPKVGLADSRITGVEALIRWNDPVTGLVPPGRFIPILEETGMIFEVGHWAMQQAVAQHRAWASMGFEPLRVAVNVSPLQLRHRDFVAEVKRAVQSGPAADSGLDLEITESVIMEDLEHNIAKLEAVRDLGVNIAIDDFGTGYSSFSYLAKLPVTSLKIDRSFVIEMTEGPQGLAIVSTIINLAHTLKLKVVAEGVETEEQSKLLKLLSCDEMQGYLFSKPIPAEQLEALLARNPPPPGAP